MEFSLEPNNCLRSSLRQILKNGDFSDVQINLNGNKSYNLHKSILSARSEKFSYFFDYFENKNDSDTFFSEKLKPILKKTTSVFEEKKYMTEFGRENNVSIFHDRKPKSLKTIAWRLESKAEVKTQNLDCQSELEMDLESDSDELNGLEFQLNESKGSSIRKPDVQKKPIENQNGFLKLKLWKPSVKGKIEKCNRRRVQFGAVQFSRDSRRESTGRGRFGLGEGANRETVRSFGRVRVHGRYRSRARLGPADAVFADFGGIVSGFGPQKKVS